MNYEERKSEITKYGIIAGFLFIVVVSGFLFLNIREESSENITQFESIPFEFQAATVKGAAGILGNEYHVFTHPEQKFSFEYPKELSVYGFRESDGAETIVFQRKEDELNAASKEKLGFQIFISPFGEDERLTRERILEDLPGTMIREPQEVFLGTEVEGNNINALLFWSKSPKVGKTREAWFIYEEFLYEITTYAHLDVWLAKILSTWRFE